MHALSVQVADHLRDIMVSACVEENEVTEHAVQMSGGGMHVRSDDPEVEQAYPMDRWIPNQQRLGGKVYTRRIIVVEDWHEVPEA